MKKFKLFTTIASLCLAVALMAFGVYAATQATVTVSSSVTFGATGNVKATVSYKLAYTGTKDTTDSADWVGIKTFDGTEKTGDTENKGAINLGADLVAADGNTGTVSYMYTIQVKNNATTGDSKNTLVVKVTYPTEGSETLVDNGYKITVTKMTGDEGEGVAVAAGGTIEYSVKIEINANKSLDAAKDLGSVIALSVK